MYYSHILYRLVSDLVCCVCDRQYQVLFVVSSMTASFEQFVVACFEEFVVCCIWPCLKHAVVCCSFFEEF